MPGAFEHIAARDVADGPRAVRGGFEILVRLHEILFVRLQVRGLDVPAVGVRLAPGCDEQLLALHVDLVTAV